jgi:choline dehydrogenase-like flavoprotein
MDLRRFRPYDRVSRMKLSRIPNQNACCRFIMTPMGGLTRTPPTNDTSYVTITAVNQHAFSRGSVVSLNQCISKPGLIWYQHINTTDPMARPVINPNYLDNPFDTQVLVHGVEYVNRIAASVPFSNVIVERIDPPTNFTTDADFER